jgi:hypothetical protein
MKVECPICHRMGFVQQRGNSVRIGHYVGYKGKTRIVEWHKVDGNQLLVINVKDGNQC